METIELNNKTEFPKGKIILQDGRMVDCYPKGIVTESDKTTQPSISEQFAKKRELELDKERFIKNAFYFLAHKERILTDSRMFLCPVPILSGMSISGTSGVRHPTLGVYLEWWMSYPGAMPTDKKNRKCLVYHLAGSNMSGSNHCAAIREDGKIKEVSLYPFSEALKSFAKINTAYMEAKILYQAYTIKQVLEILDHEEMGDVNYAKTIDDAFFIHEIDTLNGKVRYFEEYANKMSERCQMAQKSLKEEKMLRFYAEYKLLEVQTGFELEVLQQQKRDMKTAFRNGELTNELYQHKLIPINTRIKDIKKELVDFKFKEIQKVFPDKDVAFYQIQNFIDKQERESCRRES